MAKLRWQFHLRCRGDRAQNRAPDPPAGIGRTDLTGRMAATSVTAAPVQPREREAQSVANNSESPTGYWRREIRHPCAQRRPGEGNRA